MIGGWRESLRNHGTVGKVHHVRGIQLRPVQLGRKAVVRYLERTVRGEDISVRSDPRHHRRLDRDAPVCSLSGSGRDGRFWSSPWPHLATASGAVHASAASGLLLVVLHDGRSASSARRESEGQRLPRSVRNHWSKIQFGKSLNIKTKLSHIVLKPEDILPTEFIL